MSSQRNSNSQQNEMQTKHYRLSFRPKRRDDHDDEKATQTATAKVTIVRHYLLLCLLGATILTVYGCWQSVLLAAESRMLDWKLTDINDAYELPICFITSQFGTSAAKADKIVDLTEFAPHLVASPSMKFFAFTNMEDWMDASTGWERVLKQNFTYGRFITQSRWPKFQGFRDETIQQHCRVVFYMDGNLVPLGTVQDYQAEAKKIVRSGPKLAQKKHPDNPNPELEFYRINKWGKDLKENTRASIKWLRAQPDYSSDCQMYENAAFGYDIDSVAFQQTANFFWNRYSLELDSWRDQPLWCYALWHTHTHPIDLTRGLFKLDIKRSGMGGHSYTAKSVQDARAHAQITKQNEERKRHRQRPKDGIFRLLCTTDKGFMDFGSYKLRCHDWKKWAMTCAPKVNITTGVTIEQALISSNTTTTGSGSTGSGSSSSSNMDYDATLVVKQMLPFGNGIPSKLGVVFLDLVDNYGLSYRNTHADVKIIAQTERQKQSFPSSKFSVVEHWYNSFPDDMHATDKPGELPEYAKRIDDSVLTSSTRPLRVATVWNPVKHRGEGTCPSLTAPLNDTVQFDCIEREFDIADWFVDVYSGGTNETAKVEEAKELMNKTLSDPGQGRGRLYYHLFQKYDVLMALTKNNRRKLKYGNVQRIVSQMRSGVPVLVEVRGPVLEDFMNQYNYTCAFERRDEHTIRLKSGVKSIGNLNITLDDQLEGNSSKVVTTTKSPEEPIKSNYWTLEDAIKAMKDPGVRRECQRQGLVIARDYSPSKIGQKLLRAVGYEEDFEC